MRRDEEVIRAYLGRSAVADERAMRVERSDAEPMLEFRAVDTHYGDLHVLKAVDYRIEAGEIVSLLGGNASGKSTTMKAIMGTVSPTRGEILFEAQSSRECQHRRAGAARHRPGAGGAAALSAHDGLREP